MKLGFWLLSFLLLAGLLLSGCAGAPSRGWSGPVVTADMLFVGTMEGKLVSYTLITEPRPAAADWWRFPPRGEPGLGASGGGGGFCAPAPVASIYSTPSVADGVVYIGGQNGKVYAIDAETGTAIWEYPWGGSIGPIVGSPVVDDGVVYIGSSDGKLHALDAEGGQEVWVQPFPTGDDIWGTPAVSGGVVYIGSFDHKFYAINAENGQELWQFPTQGAIASTPLIHNGTIYFGSFDENFYAIDLDGNEKWRFRGGNWFWARAVAHGDIIIAGCLDHRVYALDAQSGGPAWPQPYETGGSIRADLALVGDLVIIGSEDGKVYALAADTGAVSWLKTLDAPIRAPLFGGDGVVYVHTTAGTLYALETEHGTPLWPPKYTGE